MSVLMFMSLHVREQLSNVSFAALGESNSIQFYGVSAVETAFQIANFFFYEKLSCERPL